jgi:hypothetical protein
MDQHFQENYCEFAETKPQAVTQVTNVQRYF